MTRRWGGVSPGPTLFTQLRQLAHCLFFVIFGECKSFEHTVLNSRFAYFNMCGQIFRVKYILRRFMIADTDFSTGSFIDAVILIVRFLNQLLRLFRFKNKVCGAVACLGR
jgi:hypothetical protein